MLIDEQDGASVAGMAPRSEGAVRVRMPIGASGGERPGAGCAGYCPRIAGGRPPAEAEPEFW